MLGATSGAQTM